MQTRLTLVVPDTVECFMESFANHSGGASLLPKGDAFAPALQRWLDGDGDGVPGDGGALCELACDNGTALHGLSVKAGGRVDRIELGACEGGGERRPGAWRMAESKTEGQARDQTQADETTKAAAAERLRVALVTLANGKDRASIDLDEFGLMVRELRAELS